MISQTTQLASIFVGRIEPVSRPCFIVVVVVGAWSPAPFGEPRSPPVANRGGRARRAHRATSRAKLSLALRLVAARGLSVRAGPGHFLSIFSSFSLLTR